MSEKITNFEKIMHGGAEVLAELFNSSLRIKINLGLCKNQTHCDEDADCRNCFIKWLNSPAEPAKPKLTEDEEIFVRWAIELGYNWIARDDICGQNAIVFRSKPVKKKYEWKDTDGIWTYADSIKYPFSFVQWSDREATYIPDLLRE